MFRSTLHGAVLDYSNEDKLGHVKGDDGLKYHFQAIDIQGKNPVPGDWVSFISQSGRRATQITIVTRRARRVLQGTVKWFDPERQCGFITGDDTVDYYVHEDDVVRGEISDGDRVEFSISWPDRGPRAEYVIKIADVPEEPLEAPEPAEEPEATADPEQAEEPEAAPPEPQLPEELEQHMGTLVRIGRFLEEVWDLFCDGRVCWRYRLLPLGGLAYVLLPFDLIPEGLIGLPGLADDVAIFFGTCWMFRRVAQKYLAKLAEAEEEQPADGCDTPDGCLHTEQILEGVYVVTCK